MADPNTRLRAWFLIHRWSSLICTLFLLLLCVTGLPLIFYEEVDSLSGEDALPQLSLPANAPPVSVDRLVEAARKERPGETLMYVYWDAEERAKVGATLGPNARATEGFQLLAFDGRTGNVLHAEEYGHGFMYVMLRLHTDMFAGLPGTLFLGVMGLLFLAAIVSGVVLYAPFMRKLVFGTVRRDKAPRVYWLDLHNLLGVATMTWLFVVGATGVINTGAELLLRAWQADQLAEMVAPYKNEPPLRVDEFASLQQAIDTAQRAVPGMLPSFVAFPGTSYSSEHHYGVFMSGSTPLTARLLRPVLIDAKTGKLTATREMPWYMTALALSQPLHFGDYGGLPLKIAWALLDIAAIVVLWSGVYLWFSRRKRRLPFEIEVTDAQAAVAGANAEPVNSAAAAAAASSIASRRLL